MLKTGTVPVSDQIQRVPAVPAGDSKLCCVSAAMPFTMLTECHSQRQDDGRRRRRRRRRAAQIAGGNGHVRSRPEAAARHAADSMTNDRTARTSQPRGARRRVGHAAGGRRLRFIQTEICVLPMGHSTVGVGVWRLDYHSRHKTDGISLQRGTLYKFQPCADLSRFITVHAHMVHPGRLCGRFKTNTLLYVCL